MRQALADKLEENISNVYSNQLKWVVSLIPIGVDKQGLKSETIVAQLLKQNFSPATFNNVRAHLLALETNLKKYGYTGSFANDCKKMKFTQTTLNFQSLPSNLYFLTPLGTSEVLVSGCDKPKQTDETKRH